MENARQKVDRILKNLTSSREDLWALNDDIWHTLDHSSVEDVQRAASFQVKYLELLDQFARNSEEIAALIVQFTGIKEEETPDIKDVFGNSNERIIKELNKEEPHSIDEDFTYKRPYAIVMENNACTNLETWKDLYKQVCRHLAGKNKELFDFLAANESLVSKQQKKYYSDNPKELRAPVKITDKTYVETNLSASDFTKRMKEIFDIYRISKDSLTIYLRQDRNG